jgi:GDPmannose 4,6-dehydratase
MDPTALILGVAGQDGSYLAELLLSKGYRVVGTARDLERARAALAPPVRDRLELVQIDLRDLHEFPALLARHTPAEVYNLAGFSSGVGMFEDPASMGIVNGVAVAHLLEAVRQSAPRARFCQASSSEMFGETTESPQTEESPFRPRSPYGAAKLYAHAMVRIYRKRYAAFACSAILYNHESPRRGLEFVTRKVAHGAARIKLGLAEELRLGNLDARRDWGFAGDTVRALWLAMQAADPDDYVIATGQTHTVRDLCKLAFARVGLDYRAHVREEPTEFRPAESVPLVGSATKARAKLGWVPEVGFDELVTMMVDAEMRALAAGIGRG